jgi:hypothetical protein
MNAEILERRVCAAMSLALSEARVRRRRHDRVLVRWTIWLALHRAGMTLTAIKDRWGYDRSTVLYGIRKASEEACLVAVAREAVRPVRGTAWLKPALELSYPESLWVASYLRELVGGRPFGAAGLCGLGAIAHDPRCAKAALAALTLAEEQRHLSRMAVHLRQRG